MRRFYAFVFVLSATTPAAAQTAPARGTRDRIEIDIGGAWVGSASMAALNATETQAGGTPRAVFAVSPELTSAAALEARIGVRVTRELNIEATGSYARPQLQVAASNDVEGAAGVTASESLQEFTIGGAATWFFRRRTESATRPFVTGGVAYMRQLHEPSTFAQNGAVVDAGGGVDHVLRARAGRMKAVGVRADARVRVRSSALSVDGRMHLAPVLAASLFLRF